MKVKKIPWNKGMVGGYVCSEETKRKISMANKGRVRSEEARKKISEAGKGRVPWNKGIVGRVICSEETKKKISQANIGRKNSEESKRRMSEVKKGKKFSLQHKERLSESRRRLVCKPEFRALISNFMKAKWKDPLYSKMMFRAQDRVINKTELKLYSLLNSLFPGEFKFVGDGKVFISGKCPDFINVNGKKLIIELFGDYYHIGGKKEERDRIKVFKPYGYKTLIVREKELKNEVKLKRRLSIFMEV